jgi:hypothetical protein
MYAEQLNDYYEILERKFTQGIIGHKQFAKSLEKLDEWYETFVERFGEELEEWEEF